MALDGLDKLATRGHGLLDEDEPVDAHTEFGRWVSEVGRWLGDTFPDSGLVAEWGALGHSNLVRGNSYFDDVGTWTRFRLQVEARLRWLAGLPTKVALLSIVTPARAQDEAQQAGRKEIKLQTVSRAYVDPDRIAELKNANSPAFDLTRLVRMCEELNVCFAGECYLSMIMQTRAIIDHVPPIFACRSFAEVGSSYGGTRSFKEAMVNLDSSSRKIADNYLHAQIRKTETLPNITQVDFSNAVDLLLSEVVRILK